MATGNTLVTWLASAGVPPTSNGATFNIHTTVGGIPHIVAEFDQTTNESLIFAAIMPRIYAGGGVTVYIHYCTTAITGDVDWDVSFERVGDQQQDIDSDSFSTPISVDNTIVPGTAGLVDIVSTVHTNGAQMDSIAVGEYFRCMVTRDAVSDTCAADVQLLCVEIKET